MIGNTNICLFVYMQIISHDSELQITIRKKNDVVPCPKKRDVTHALSEAHWQHSAIESFLSNTFCIISFCSA
jgi:hypothetical protein